MQRPVGACSSSLPRKRFALIGRYDGKRHVQDRLRVDINRLSQNAHVTFLPDSGFSGSATLSRNELLRLIQELGKVHSALLERQPIPKLEYKKAEAIFNTRWSIQPELDGGASALCFYHTGFGTVGFLLPIHEAERLAKTLARQVAQAEKEGRRENL